MRNGPGGRVRLVCVLLVGLALAPLVSGCGGASPETRAAQTMRALRGTRTPTHLEAARKAIAQGTVTGIDQGSAGILTAEAYLPIAAPRPSTAPTRRIGPAATPDWSKMP